MAARSPGRVGDHQALWAAAGDYEAEGDASQDVLPTAAPLLMMFGPPFARQPEFWLLVAISCIVGAAMSIVALGFSVIIEGASELLWFTEAYRHSLASKDGAKLGSGDLRWIGLGAAAGVAVTLVKLLYGLLVVRVPFELKGTLFAHIKDLDVHDWREAPCVFLVAAISLGCGCSLGPEAPLGICGAAMSYLVLRMHERFLCRDAGDDSSTDAEDEGCEVVSNGSAAHKERQQMEKLCVRSGIAAAMGSVFPSSVVATIMVQEMELVVSDFRHAVAERALKVTVMEGFLHTAIASTVSWSLCSYLKEHTFLKPEELPDVAQNYVRFNYRMVLVAVFIGVVGAFVGVMAFIINMIGKICFGKLRLKLNHIGTRCGMTSDMLLLGDALLPVIGGAMYGGLAVACPLSVGDGNAQLPALLKFGNSYGVTTLLVTALAKMLALAVCNATGFIGGPIFPLIFAGSCVGRAMVDVFPDAFDDINLTMLFIPCMSVAVGCAYTPLVLTMTFTVVVSYVVGAQWTTLVFVSGCTSFLVGCGLGAVQTIVVGRVETPKSQ